MENSVLVVTKQDAGKEIRLAVGQTLRVDVKDVSTTGYRWSATHANSGLLELMEEEMKPSAGIGGAGARHYIYKALAPGAGTLTFILKRPWESAALEEFAIRVRVEAKTS
jgi:predicted secreted protein